MSMPNNLFLFRHGESEGNVAPHCDGKSCINLISLIILEGQGNFCTCANREGNNSVPIRNAPGDLLLMRGPGFLASDIQPFHFVNNITVRRTSFGLRHIKKERRV